MTQSPSAARAEAIAREAFGLLGTLRQVSTFSSRYEGFCLDEAYEVVEQVRGMREAQGERSVGRKIGFTNSAAWVGYGISGPIWNYVYDCTVHNLADLGNEFALKDLAEPRIEPEIALHLTRRPHADMTDADLLGCIDWICHAFEMVNSVFPGWSFTAADATAAFGVHTALLIGEKTDTTGERARWLEALSGFEVELSGSNGQRRQGHAQNVLGGPLKALRFLLQELDRLPGGKPLRAGELVTTGTLTEAMPALAGETWVTSFIGIDLGGLRVTLR
jgi:2-oxo-3-hexenedioate decarboxylase